MTLPHMGIHIRSRPRDRLTGSWRFLRAWGGYLSHLDLSKEVLDPLLTLALAEQDGRVQVHVGAVQEEAERRDALLAEDPLLAVPAAHQGTNPPSNLLETP